MSTIPLLRWPMIGSALSRFVRAEVGMRASAWVGTFLSCVILESGGAALAAPVANCTRTQVRWHGQDVVAGELLVRFREGVSTERRASAHAKLGTTLVRRG